MHKWAQVSAWLHIHLCSCSQIQSRYFWFDSTTKGPCDGWKMRRALTCHFNPTCFHSSALPSWPLPVRSAFLGPHPDSHVFNPALLFLVHMYSLSLPSHPHSATLHFSSTATAGLACASPACISLWSSSSNILNEPLLLQTGVYVFPFLFFSFFYTRALGCHLIQCEDITWSLPEIICWIGEKEPWSPVIQTDTSLQTASIHPSTRTRRRESSVSSHQSSFISPKWQFLWVSGTFHSL